MTSSDPEATAEGPAPRRLLVAVVGSVVLGLGAMLVIFAIGVRGVPDYRTVDEQPEPVLEGRIAYIRWGEPSGNRYVEPCVYVRDIGEGEDAEVSVWCGEAEYPGGGPSADPVPAWLEWDAEGHLLVGGHQRDGAVVVTLDAESGVEIRREDIDQDEEFQGGASAWPARREDGALVGTTWDEDGWAEVWVREPGSGQRTLVRERGPDGYSFWGAGWSPRGDYVLVSDSERRTLVIAVEGDPAPRELVRDVDWVAWFQPS